LFFGSLSGRSNGAGKNVFFFVKSLGDFADSRRAGSSLGGTGIPPICDERLGPY
jgi:hypothetical protein